MIGLSPPEVAMIQAPGTNRERDLGAAFEAAGARVTSCLLGSLVADASPLRHAQIIALPGGFSFGDALGAGRLWGLALDTRLGDALRTHLGRGGLVLGICNGFQALLRSGILTDDGPLAPRVALAPNVGGAFVCGWTTLVPAANSVVPSVVAFAHDQKTLDCPVAHAEGRFFAPDPETLAALESHGQIAFRYASAPPGPSAWLGNPNGSALAIAGISNRAGTALGLMPHPENHIRQRQHPGGAAASRASSGLPFFRAMLAQVA